MAKRIGPPLTQEQRDKIEEDLYSSPDFKGFLITDKDGKKYRLKGGSLIPVSGEDAQAAVKKKRSKKPKAGEG